MGGKVWSAEEEHVFWTVIIPSSGKKAFDQRPTITNTHGWQDLAIDMQILMGSLARRQYTPLMLYEHYFQNVVLESFSPYARSYARAYIREEVASTGLRPCERSNRTVRDVPHHVNVSRHRRMRYYHAGQEQGTTRELSLSDEHRPNETPVGGSNGSVGPFTMLLAPDTSAAQATFGGQLPSTFESDGRGLTDVQGQHLQSGSLTAGVAQLPLPPPMGVVSSIGTSAPWTGLGGSYAEPGHLATFPTTAATTEILGMGQSADFSFLQSMHAVGDRRSSTTSVPEHATHFAEPTASHEFSVDFVDPALLTLDGQFRYALDIGEPEEYYDYMVTDVSIPEHGTSADPFTSATAGATSFFGTVGSSESDGLYTVQYLPQERQQPTCGPNEDATSTQGPDAGIVLDAEDDDMTTDDSIDYGSNWDDSDDEDDSSLVLDDESGEDADDEDSCSDGENRVPSQSDVGSGMASFGSIAECGFACGQPSFGTGTASDIGMFPASDLSMALLNFPVDDRFRATLDRSFFSGVVAPAEGGADDESGMFMPKIP